MLSTSAFLKSLECDAVEYGTTTALHTHTEELEFKLPLSELSRRSLEAYNPLLLMVADLLEAQADLLPALALRMRPYWMRYEIIHVEGVCRTATELETYITRIREAVGEVFTLRELHEPVHSNVRHN